MACMLKSRTGIGRLAPLLVCCLPHTAVNAQCTNGWHPYDPVSGLPEITDPRLAFDSVRNVMVVVAAGPNQAGLPTTATWEFQPGPGLWSFRHNTLFRLCDAPVAPLGPWTITAGAGDYIDGGGYNCFGGGFQTWMYNGGNWERDTTQPGGSVPSVRAGHAMAYHAGIGRIVLFGGSNTQLGTYPDDTWEYGGNWDLQDPAQHPTGRANPAMTYDPVREVIIMYGGTNPDDGYVRQTWEYDGTTWTQRGGTQPPGLVDALFTFDERRNCGVLQGGFTSNGGYYFGTWEYRDGVWTQGATVPQGLGSDGGMAYDPRNRAVMLYDPDWGPGLHDPTMFYYGCSEPEIHFQPENQFLCNGDLLYLNCGARGIGNHLNFQWRRNSTDIPGATSSIYIRQDAVPGDTGVYRCFVSNPDYGTSALSEPAIVIVDNGPPSIQSHPVSRFVCEGVDVTFTVQATNLWSYQWRRSGVPIPGATSSTYTINNVSSNDASTYDCLISNYCGSVDSSNAFLVVNEAPNVLVLGATSIMIDAGQNALFDAASFGTQPMTLQWLRNGVAISNGPGGASPGGGAVSGATTTDLLITAAQPPDSGVYQLRATNTCGEDIGTPIILTVDSGCPADFDSNGIVAVPDIFAFLSAWFAQGPGADFDNNGTIAVPDIFAFLSAWFAGC